MALLAMLSFCISDVLAKLLSQSLPSLEIAWFRYLGGIIALAPFILRSPHVFHSAAPTIQIVRSICMVGATTLLIAALQVMPIAEATTLVFVSPIFVTAFSYVLLKEKSDRVRLACVVAGLAGVAMVARPDMGKLDHAAWLPILSALCWALAMVLTRPVQSRGDSFLTTLTYAASGGFVALCLVLPFIFVVPTMQQLLVAAAMSFFWTMAQIAVLAAYRIGRVSDVAPFAYTQIVWSVIFGYFILSEFPDALALTGCTVVIVSGTIAARRSHQGA
jgi:drug/metabolite transporter (DMT)-like permease